jgi:ParB family chromosome partitioning protein
MVAIVGEVENLTGGEPAEDGGTTGAENHPGSTVIIELDPFECRVWASHDRPEEELTVASCRAEMEHIRRHGQAVPVIGRPIADDPNWKAEIICGARRLFIARQLGIPLRVELRQLTDREAFAVMDGENRLRKDLSHYARGLSYASALRNNVFKSQRELARSLGISVAQVTRCVMVARLPAIVVDAFPSSADIREGWGVALCHVCRSEELRTALVARARRLAGMHPRLPPEVVYRKLIRGLESHGARAPDELIRDPRTQKIVCRIRERSAMTWLGFRKGAADRRKVAKILEFAQRVMQSDE